MIWTLVLWGSVVWLAPLICVMLGNEAKCKKNLIVGVTLPFAAREDPQVQARLARFRKELAVVCLALVAAAGVCVLAAGGTLAMTPWLIWLDVCIVLPYVPYVRCNRDLKAIKRSRGWQQPRGEITVDTKAVPSYHWVPVWLFLPALLLCLLPMLWERSFWAVYLTDGACVVLFWLGYRYLYCSRAEMVDDNAVLTRVLTQVRRYNWGRTWLICAYSMAVLNLGISLTTTHPVAMAAVILAVSCGIVAAVLQVEFGMRRVQAQLTAQSGRGWYVDEDDKWVGGVLYYNPNDSRTLINSRVGINTSVNLARPLGKLVIGAVALLLLALPFTGVLLDAAGTQPIDLSLSENALVCTHGCTEYTIALEEIRQVELLQTLPEDMVRTFGTGMDCLLKGNFTAQDLGSMKVCLDPSSAPFLYIITEGGKTYLLGCRDPGQIAQIYAQLQQLWGQVA